MVLLAVSIGLVAYDVTRSGDSLAGTEPAVPAAAAPPSDQVAPPTANPDPAVAAPPSTVLADGTGTFTYAATGGPVVGHGGDILAYRVAVEDGSGVIPDAFAGAVEATLADPRSWIAGGDVRLQRVGGSAPAAFTVFLATPATSQRMCREEWMETQRYTSCRLSDGRVVINLDRWLTAVPDYGAPLAVYQAYAINHEVGHQLGHGHESCPGPGQPAPVMLQQTLGLQGCTANAWPYLGGARYRGPPSAAR